MANATARTKTVEDDVTVKLPLPAWQFTRTTFGLGNSRIIEGGERRVPDGVTLELTQEEAEALVDVTRNIAGHPNLSRRGLLASIGGALEDAGIKRRLKDYADLSGIIIFTKNAQ